MDRFFQAAVVASHQDFGFQAALQGWARYGIFLASCLFLQDGAVMVPWMMLQYKAWSGCFGSRHDWTSCLLVTTVLARTVFETAHATADENKGIVEWHEVPVSVFSVAETAGTAATAGENKGIVGLHEVNESDRFRTDAAVAAATAGESEETISLLESLSQSFHLSEFISCS